MINDTVKCSEDESKKDLNFETDEKEIDLLKGYDKASTTMSLGGKSLTSLPSEISTFTQIKFLLLNCNKFDKVPDILSQLKALELLSLHYNEFETFPNEVILKNLKHLYLRSNQITFPKLLSDTENIMNLDITYPQLEELDISDNKIESIPTLKSTSLKTLYLNKNKISNIHETTFIGLSNLNYLKLTFNQIKEINNSIIALKHLVTLYLYCNQIEMFILDRGCLEQLKYLDLGYNKITEFKVEQSIVPQIKALSLTSNGLSTVPSDIYNLTSLRVLSLSYNDITEIHDSISNLTNLRLLDLSGNRISKIPESISKLTKLKMFRISFEHLEKESVPSWVTSILRDDKDSMSYQQYIDSAEKLENSPQDDLKKED